MERRGLLLAPFSCYGVEMVVLGFGAGVASGLPPGFHWGRQVVLLSQRMGATMEAMALVMWLKSMVRSSSEGWW